MRCDIDAGVANLGLAVIGGYVGTRLMEPVSTKLYELESAEDRQREDAVRPGAPHELAARKISEAVGLRLSRDQVQTLGTYGFHYGLGTGWGVVYAVLRAAVGLRPFVAGLLTGASLSLIVDDGLTPALGFSAPNSAYPLATHVRGFAAHIVYGLGTMAAAETLRWLGAHADYHAHRT